MLEEGQIEMSNFYDGARVLTAQTQHNNGFTYFAAYYGFASAPTLVNSRYAYWIGLSAGWVFQPVMIWNGPSPAIQNVAFLQNQPEQMVPETPKPIPLGTAVWGIIQYLGKAKAAWTIDTYFGTPAGPTTKAIPTLTMPNDPTGQTYGIIKTAICVKERLDSNGSCSNENTHGVFGGLALKAGKNFVPVKWRGYVQDNECHPSIHITNPTLNPNCQVDFYN